MQKMHGRIVFRVASLGEQYASLSKYASPLMCWEREVKGLGRGEEDRAPGKRYWRSGFAPAFPGKAEESVTRRVNE